MKPHQSQLTPREIARTILAGGGGYLLVAKENQPQLHAAIEATFAPWAAPVGLVGVACTVDAHGGRGEQRRLMASSALVGDSDWPGLRQALMVDRRVLHKASGRRLRQEVACAVTPCPPQRATPAQLRALWRGHWRVENGLHSIRDATFDEDRASVRAGHAPQVMAAFRNAALGLLRRLGATNLAALGLSDLE